MKIDNIRDITKAIQTLDDSINNAKKVLGTGPTSYYIEKLIGYYIGCMEAAKFKEGDNVQLAVTPRPFPSGWNSGKHFIKKGAKATVHSIDYFRKNGDEIGQYMEVIYSNQKVENGLNFKL